MTNSLLIAPRGACAGSGGVEGELEEARRRIAAALERGAVEAVIPASGSAGAFERLRRLLSREGFGVSPVTGEDGPYSVVYW